MRRRKRNSQMSLAAFRELKQALARLVTLASQFESAIWFSSQTRSANAKSILSMLELGLSEGTPFTVTVKGRDAEQALEAICALVGEPALCGDRASAG